MLKLFPIMIAFKFLPLLLFVGCGSTIEVRQTCMNCDIDPQYKVVQIDTVYYEGGGSIKKYQIKIKQRRKISAW